MKIGIDKGTLIPIILMIVFVPSMIFLIMGTVPEIFRQGEQIDTSIQEQHEDEARENQTRHEDEREARQANETRNEIKTIVTDHHQDLIEFMHRENNTTNKLFDKINGTIIQNSKILSSLENKSKDHEKMSINVNTMQESLNKISQEILNISKEHKVVQKDHDIIQTDVNNITKEIFDLLTMAAERNYQATLDNKEIIKNITKSLEEIKELVQ